LLTSQQAGSWQLRECRNTATLSRLIFEQAEIFQHIVVTRHLTYVGGR
jgi:hypothetical protein